MKINKIKLSGFKSIADVELNDLTPFSVFAGANGAGKSNFFDALKFLSTVVTFGATQALRQFHGYDNVHCFKHRKNKARTFSTTVYFSGENLPILNHYYLNMIDMDGQPKLDEEYFSASKDDSENNDKSKFPPNFPKELSILMVNPTWDVTQYLQNIRVYRFDPLGAKNSPNADKTELDWQGHNLAAMLSELEKNDEIREQIIEWMELLVPNLETVSTEHSRFDTSTMLRFKEAGIKAKFPAHLISDGTIYALCIMVAVLSRCKQPGMTLIEEPERGIHPQAIAELVGFMRENANSNHAIFVTTHSESVVRHSKPEELWLVNKIDGKTEFKNAGKKFSNLGDLSLDKAWLMNFFGGGLPW